MASIKSIREQFVPEDGITRAVLEDNLTRYFPKGAIIEKKIQLGSGGEVGWFIAGGRVSEQIITSLREETWRRKQREQRDQRDQRDVQPARTQRPALPPKQPLRQSIASSASQWSTQGYESIASESSQKRHTGEKMQIAERTASESGQTQRTGDRHNVRNESPGRQYPPTRASSLLPLPDIDEGYSPADLGRYKPTDAVEIASQHRQPIPILTDQLSQSNPYGRHNRPNTDPAYAAEHPERVYSRADFDTFTRFEEFVRLRHEYEQAHIPRSPLESQERLRNYPDDRSNLSSQASPPPPPPPYSPEDLRSRPPRQDSLRDARGRDDDDDDEGNPIYGQNRPTYGSRHTTERNFEPSRGTRIGRDEDDEDPDFPGIYGQRMDIDEPEERPRARRAESPTDRSESTTQRRSGEKRYHYNKPKGGRYYKSK